MRKTKFSFIAAVGAVCGMLLSSFSPAAVNVSMAQASRLKLNKKTVNMKEGQKYSLKVTVKPMKLISRLKFKSSNKKIAKVSKSGKITAVKKGTAKITVTVKKTKLKKICKVVVRKADKQIVTNNQTVDTGLPSVTLPVGQPEIPSSTPKASQSETPLVTPADIPSAVPSVTPAGSQSAAPMTTPAVRPSAATSATPASPSATPSAKSSVTPSVIPTVKPTAATSINPSVTPSATPTFKPSATPLLKVASTADIADKNICEGENGGSGSYKADSSCIECNLGAFNGIVLNIPADGQFSGNIVELTYTSTGLINTYLYDESYNGVRGADDGSIQVDELAAASSEQSVRFSLGDGKTIKAVKLFNFTGEQTLRIKSLKVLTIYYPTPEPSYTPESSYSPDSDYVPVKQFLEDEEFLIPDSSYDIRRESNAGITEKISYPSTVIKEGETVNRNAVVCLPKNYDKSKKYPVIYMMHGIFGNETTLSGDNDVKDVLWNAVAAGVAKEAILVFPSGCANEYNGTGDVLPGFSVEHYEGYNNFLNDFEQCLKPYIDSHYSTLTDRNNTAICGFSMGGRVTLHLGFKLQSMFRYVGAFCPAPGIFDYSHYGVTSPGLFTKDEFKLEDKYMNDTLVMIIKGSKDYTVEEFPQTYHDALADNKVPHIYRITNGGPDENGDGGHGPDVYRFGFYNFIKRIFKKTTDAPSPAPKPTPAYKVITNADIKAAGFYESENGGTISYNAESNSVDCKLGGLNGVVLNVPKNGQFAGNIVELTYTSTGKINAYLYDDNYNGTRGLNDGSVEVDSINSATKEAAVRFTFGDNRMIKAIKLFNFTGEQMLKITSMKVLELDNYSNIDAYTKEVLTINMTDTNKYTVAGSTCTVDMQYFTGTSDSSYFKGNVMKESSNVIKRYKADYNGGKTLSTARYFLEGKDSGNNSCKIFIEDNSVEYKDDDNVITKPTIITDSTELSWLQTADLRGILEDKGNGNKTIHVMWNEANSSKIPYPAVKYPDTSKDYTRELFTFNIGVGGSDGVEGTDRASASMIYFTCSSNSSTFKGNGIDNNWGFADTRMKFGDQVQSLSARYILTGKDDEGKDCKIYVENNGIDNGVMTTEPTIITDNPKWAWIETAPLHGTVSWDTGLTIHMWTTASD